MRIAILISGRLYDSVQQYQNTLEMIVQNNNVDFFVSHSLDTSPQVLKRFTQMYKPVRLIQNDEMYPEVGHYLSRPEVKRHNTMCMFQNRYNVFNLCETYIRETGTQYDLFYSLRCDLLFQDILDTTSLFDMMKTNICIPNGNNYGGTNDQCAFTANFEILRKYMCVYSSLLSMLSSGIILHPETLLYRHLEKNHVKVVVFPLRYTIQRYNYL